MSTDPLVRIVQDRIFGLVKEAASLEAVRWLMWVDDCFDGGDFDAENFGNLRWRLEVLRGQHLEDPDSCGLIAACQRVLDGDRARRRNEAVSLGNLWTGRGPVRALSEHEADGHGQGEGVGE